MIGAFHILADPGVDIVIACDGVARLNFGATKIIKSGLVQYLAGQPDTAPPRINICLFAQIVEGKAWGITCLIGLNGNVAPACRFVWADMNLKPVTTKRCLTVIADCAGQEVILNVGGFKTGG